MQIPLLRGDEIKGVEWRDSLPVNMYAVQKQILGAAGYMIQNYGLRLYAEGQGVDRGAIFVTRSGFEGQYRVSGKKLIKVLPDGSATTLGDIPGSDEVSMDFSFNNLAIVANKKLYYYSPSKGLRQITDPESGSPIDIVWVDGYFFLTDGEDIYHSNIADEEQYEPLSFGNAQFSPDPSLGLGKNAANEVLVFGSRTVEYFINTGAGNFSFQRIQRKAQKIGILGTDCKKELNNKFMAIGRREETAPSLHMISGGQNQDVGTRETYKILAQYTDSELATATIDAMVIDGVEMAIYHLPRHTLLLNLSTIQSMGLDNSWSILKSDIVGNTPYRAKNPIRNEAGKWIVGDKQNSNIGEIDETLSTQYGNIIEWIMFTPMIPAESMSLDYLDLQTTPGTAEDNDATVAVSMSFDGRTHSREYWELYGDNLDYNQRFILRRLGFIREYFSLKFRGASRSRMSFAKCNVELS